MRNAVKIIHEGGNPHVSGSPISLARIERILGQLKTQVMLLDANGQVILPKDNRRDLQLPEMLTRDPPARVRRLHPHWHQR